MEREVSAASLMETLIELDRIGIRFAGSPGERASADWIAARFRDLGLDPVTVETFPCLSYRPVSCRVTAHGPDRDVEIPAEPAAHCPSSPGAGIKGPLVVIEKLQGPGSVSGRRIRESVVLIYSSEFFERARLETLMAARPAAVLVVDDRFTHDRTVAVGFPAAWVPLLKCPVVNVPYTAAWDMLKSGVASVSMAVETERPPAASTNVVAEIRGTVAPSEVVVISAHHDTVINSSGVDDNGSGVACVLELARLFAAKPPARTLRFISFGAEEQLSEGARHYVLGCSDLDRIQFVLNVDAVGAVMGKTKVYYSGPAALRRELTRTIRETGCPLHLAKELSPFSDHFPFNVQGIPAVWYYRTTSVAARHFHHSREETLDVISAEVLARTVRHQAALLAAAASIPAAFPRILPGRDLKRLQQMGKDWMTPPTA